MSTITLSLLRIFAGIWAGIWHHRYLHEQLVKRDVLRYRSALFQ